MADPRSCVLGMCHLRNTNQRPARADTVEHQEVRGAVSMRVFARVLGSPAYPRHRDRGKGFGPRGFVIQLDQPENQVTPVMARMTQSAAVRHKPMGDSATDRGPLSGANAARGQRL